MAISFSCFGTTRQEEPVTQFRLEGEQGAFAEILDYGCVVRTLWVPDWQGRLVDVVLGYDTVAEYEDNDGYLGAFVGRHANRIEKGKFCLNGTEYALAVNNGPNHLHGGLRGFNQYVFSSKVEGDRLILTRTSPHGEEGYPGTLIVTVTYSFVKNALMMTYDAVCDGDTVINLTNHSYFNLNGGGSIGEHLLQIYSDTFTENDADCLPTGKILRVDDTPFDFRSAKPIGRDISAEDINLKNGSGYDHNFILGGTGLRTCALLQSLESGICMEVLTTQPGIQCYSANFLTTRKGKRGAEYHPRDAICLETQHWPNATSHPNFPSVVLSVGEAYHQETVYRFTVNNKQKGKK